MAALVQQYLDLIRSEHAGVAEGALASYIPELTTVDPDGFGVSLSSSDGFVYESGDAALEFTIQSISKPFTYALALDQIGQRAVDAKIGVEPSGEAFNEISVDPATKTPKNPMINAGAIAAVSLVPGATPDEKFALIREFYSAFAGRQLEIDPQVYASEKRTGSRNRAIATCWPVSVCSTVIPTTYSTCTSGSARSTSRPPTWPGWPPRWPAAVSIR